jgi:hypothetical protein
MPIIGWIMSALVWVFKNRIGLFIAQALLWAGLTYGTTKMVMGPTISLLEGYMQSGGGGGDIGAAITNWMGVLKFDIAVTMIISAYVAKQSFNAAKVALHKRGT